MSTTATTPTKSNVPTFADLQKIANELGTEAGKGKDTRVKFQMQLVNASYLGAIDLDADKHGKDKDDATVLTETYVKAQSGASYFDAKAPNQRKECSCSRTAIRLGQWPHGGPGEPIATMNNLITEWGKLKTKPENKGILDDASNTLMKFARAQIKRDTLLDKAELHDLCFKKKPQERTFAQRLKAVAKELDKLKDLDTGNSLVAGAFADVNKRIKQIEDKAKADKAKTAQAQKAAREAHKKQQAQASA